MSRPSPYDTNQHLRGTPIRQDEVEALVYAGAKPLLKDQEALLHFLDRVLAALREARAAQEALRNELEVASMRRQASGHPLEVARQALAALSPEQARDLLDAGYWQAIDELNAQRESYERGELVLVTALRKVRFSLSALLQDQEMSDEARQALRTTIEELPSPPAPTQG